MGIRQGPGDVIAQKDDKRLARGHSGGGLRRSGEHAAGAGRNERQLQRRNPPAQAGGSRNMTGEPGHPVNTEGPRRGVTTAAAQAR
jgi:hypothetical protein